MYKTIFSVVLVLVLSACSSSLPVPKELPQKPKPNEKVFEEEDLYILFALEAEKNHDYQTAKELFFKLYEKADKKEYLYRAIENELMLAEYKDVIKVVEQELSKEKGINPQLLRFKITALRKLSRLNEAKELALELAALTQESHDYILVSNIYAQQKEYDLALKYLEGAYMKEYNEEILDKMAIILYVNLKRKKDAIAQLETHTRIHGCSEAICMRLISFYSNENNIDGLLSVYKRVYNKYKREEVAKKIIQIYTYKREYFKLIDFLEENSLDKQLLLDVYVSVKDYKEASRVAKELYTERGNIIYLGQSALYKYEAKEDSLSKKELERIIHDLQKVINKRKNDTLYLNYLGYILIDHDIDVKRGLEYVSRALEIEPNSPYYLDSLAWGYYKLGECKRADEIMKKVINLGEGEQPEVRKHVKMIKKCLQNSKKR